MSVATCRTIVEMPRTWKFTGRKACGIFFENLVYFVGGHSFSTCIPKRVGGQALCVCQCTVASDVIICAYKVIDCV